MAKILGLDLGTNSIGWAVIDPSISKEINQILNAGVVIFPKGVGEGKSGEYSLASERTNNRNQRKLYRRRKQRKFQLLKLLCRDEFNMAPLLEGEVLKWQKEGVYPQNDDFNEWLKINPYIARNNALDSSYNCSSQELGRAFYHICCRRGFKSNRKDITESTQPKDLVEYRKFKEEHSDKILGEVYFEKHVKGEKIRKTRDGDDNSVNSSRILYEEEFDQIVKAQKLDPTKANLIKREIFFQRDLKSQKGKIATCTLEKNKKRCSDSHPEFEFFRMYSFLNNVRYADEFDSTDAFHPLSNEHRELVSSLFFRKTKKQFEFGDIIKTINKATKKEGKRYKFNFRDYYPVSGCPTTTRLIEYLGEDWKTIEFDYKKENKDVEHKTPVWEDVWHVWKSFNDPKYLKTFAQGKLGLEEDRAEKFSKITLSSGYSNLSLKAIRKINPFLEKGLMYTHAVFVANIESLFGKTFWNENGEFIIDAIGGILGKDKEERQILNVVNVLMKNFKDNYNNAHVDYQLDEKDKEEVLTFTKREFGKYKWNKFDQHQKEELIELISQKFEKQLRTDRGKFLKNERIDSKIHRFLSDNFEIDREHLKNLYHPSAIDIYPKAKKNEKDGKYYLGSPLIAAIKNPMAMKTLHQLRKLVNSLIKKDIIDEETVIHIELARELNDANMRWAIGEFQKRRKNENDKNKKLIEEIFSKNNINRTPNEIDVKKYRLWVEQKKDCLYCGKKIGCAELFDGSQINLEHTLPRSKTFDNSLQNLTVAHRSCNALKDNMIPADMYEKGLLNKEDVLAKIEHWKENIEKYQKSFAYKKRPKGAETKDVKDNRIRQKHLAKMHLDYWKDKYNSFLITEIKSGFKNSQLVDTGIITKYARAYLKSLFEKVHSVKGSVVAEFRVNWGLQEAYQKKERINHNHHAVDAIVIACLTRNKYDEYAQILRTGEAGKIQEKRRLMEASKPWVSFTQDADKIANSLLIKHVHKNKIFKQTHRKIRKRGKIQLTDKLKLDKNGNPIPVKGKRKPDGTYEVVKNNKGEIVYEKLPKIEKGVGVRARLHKDTFYGANQVPLLDEAGKFQFENGKILLQTDKEGKPLLRFVVRKFVNKLEKSDIKNIVDKTIKTIVEKQGLKDAQENGLFIPSNENSSKKIVVKKLRLYQDTAVPIIIKEQSHRSSRIGRRHKSFYYASNDANYVMGIYEGGDNGKKVERDYAVVNMFDAAQFFTDELMKSEHNLLPSSVEKKVGKKIVRCRKIYELKNGQTVILKSSANEILDLKNLNEISKRLFVVRGISFTTVSKKYKYGVIVLKHHMESRKSSELKIESGVFSINDEKSYRKFLHTQFHGLIEGVHFKLDYELNQLTFIE